MADNTVPLILWIPFLLLLPLLLLLLRKQINKPQKHFPPSPPKLPIIGNLHQFTQSGSSLHQNLWRLSQKYGPLMLLHMGRRPTLIISSAEAAKQTLKDNDLHCCSRPASLGSRRLTFNYLDIAFSPYGEYWREIRKICVHEIFSAKGVESYRSIREEEVVKMIDSFSDASASSSPVNLTEKLFALMSSIIFRIVFGTSFQGSDLEHERFLRVLLDSRDMLTGFSSCAADFFPPCIGWIIDRVSGKHREFDRVSREVHRFFQQAIDDHLKPGRTQQEHEDIVDVLLKMVKKQTEIGAAHLGHNNIKAVLLDLFLGGVDTTATAMVWAMAELATNIRVMKKAQEEIRNCIGNKGKATEIDTEQLQYLKMIVKETLRLHPSGPLLLPRETMSHFKVLSYDVDPKTTIFVNDWAISRDPEFWNDPEKFIPERFDDRSVDFKGQHFDFLPFGAGRRICPGIYMAATTMELILAKLLCCFDWKVPDGMNEEDIKMEETTHGVTICLKNPLNLVPMRYSC
ncbi:putative 4-hydroxyphenylacetaldehyde oxime monooxygenase [Rosa chinensis]|uniref:Putative 4-hydroxyphenylacetaldehyde oxime monooxygenase n=1 Tax=Rosa chinensis TaxID=74649 RepID=A0A2P6QXL0_ROSCH|nr:cytochrome P450 71B34 [Rosa chinensis]PRQ38938.1 putative 4-hydroxyphenylacetaldehyde oxime monooxygenase [Rosa chinensis]